MANSFKNYTKKEVGTSVTDAYTVASSTTTVVIGITLANRSGNQINCDLILNVASGDDVYLIRNIPIPNGSSFEWMAGNKLVDKLQVKSDAAASLDVAISVLEQT
jgi:hypothetical protein